MSEHAPNVILGERFTRELELAVELHSRQARKGTGTPYLGHVLGVASLVIEDGGSEDEAIAALLHDGPEDAGGEETLRRISAEFGSTSSASSPPAATPS
ncbi:MAG TPA: HD domain-containing protein [Sandaracinaceae bacterium]